MCERNSLQSIIWGFISIDSVFYLTTEFKSQLEAIVDTLENRVLTNFENVESEADKATDEAWNESMSQPASEYEYQDPGDLAESAQEVGISLYQLLAGVRQGIINLFAVALYHCFEQQIVLFREQELRFTVEQDKLGELNTLKCQLEYLSIDITDFNAWEKITEIRLVANVTKHAEGHSADKLRLVRPSLFQEPLIGFDSFSLPVSQPLIGEGLYVSVQDINNYRDHLIGFWDELSEAMRTCSTDSHGIEQLHREDT